MLSEIPRRPTFPQHMVIKVIERLQQEVEQEVIPVSTGIYSEHKLLEKLQAIPKPILVDYDDPIFYQTFAREVKKIKHCPLCGQQYDNKKHIPLQCKFCGVWNCNECICHRRRYHPRAKDAQSARFQICYTCDDKFLGLLMNHGFVESKTILEESIKAVRGHLRQLEKQCEKRENIEENKQIMRQNKIKIAALKKSQIDLKKAVGKVKKLVEEQNVKIEIKQKYLTVLMKKKQTKSKQVLKQQIHIQKKIKRSLTHNLVVSESYKQINETPSTNIEEIQESEQNQQQRMPQENGQIQSYKFQQSMEAPDVQAKKSQNQINQTQLDYEYYYKQMKSIQSKQDQKIIELIKEDESPKPYLNNFYTYQISKQQIDIQKHQAVSTLKEHLFQFQQPKKSFIQEKLSEIFSKQQQSEYQPQWQQPIRKIIIQQRISAEQISRTKSELMRQAFESARKQRQSLEQFQLSPIERNKCTCEIF